MAQINGLVAGLLAATLLSGCDGGGAGSVCTGGFTGANLVTTTAACPGCQINDAAAAIDGNGDSAAELVFNNSGADPSGGRVSLTTSGRIYPAGSTVGAFMRFPRIESGRGFTNISASIVTYLGGVQQEMVSGTSTTFGNIEGGGQVTFYGGTANLAFDGVEAIASLGNASQPTTVNVFEICGNR